MTLFKRFVEPGRLCKIQFGPDADKLCVVIDLINQTRVLIDGPTTNVARQSIPLKRLILTDFKIKVSRGARTGTLKELLNNSNIVEQFSNSSYGKRCAAKVFKKNLTDFERHQLLVARKKRQALVRLSLFKK